MEADRENLDLDGVNTAAEVNESVAERTFCDSLTEYRSVPTEVLASLVDVMQITKYIVTIEKHFRNSNWKSQKSQRELQVANNAMLDAHIPA